MPNDNNPVSAVKRAAVEAVEATKPVNVVFGVVLSVKPLKINIEQKMDLGEKQLILTRNVTDYTVEISLDHETEPALTTHTHFYSGNTGSAGSGPHVHGYSGETGPTNLTHTHAYKGKKTFTIHNALKVGERVVLLRIQKGKKFIVLDRLEVTE